MLTYPMSWTYATWAVSCVYLMFFGLPAILLAAWMGGPMDLALLIGLVPPGIVIGTWFLIRQTRHRAS